ncbi:hypothetical protein LAZ67_20001365 [Cordylochernes scorpioides]|uniref:CCHC-type domain-containing protein n=1 Tax=Cordylochernes scorpioides TaxID=51811 RepID=A0ABY6LJZ7_9ARAC|nr:hypothetical protein LAZ67_20001365 [Cordylochernes scorpioides]
MSSGGVAEFAGINGGSNRRDECGYFSVKNIVLEFLGDKKMSARWVPKKLTDEHKIKRAESATEFLCRYGEKFLDSIVTGDETWAHNYTTETKIQSKQLRHPTHPKPKKFAMRRPNTELIKPATPAPAAVPVPAPAPKKPDPALTKRKQSEASNPPAKRTKPLVPAKSASSRAPKPAVAKGSLNGEKPAAHIVVNADKTQADPRDILKAVRAAHTLPQGVWASLRTRGKLVLHSSTPEVIPAVSSALDNKLQGLKVRELRQFLPRICLFNVEAETADEDTAKAFLSTDALSQLPGDKSVRVAHRPPTRNGTCTAFIELDLASYKAIVDQVILNYEESVRVRVCYRCCGYGHNADRCTKATAPASTALLVTTKAEALGLVKTLENATTLPNHLTLGFFLDNLSVVKSVLNSKTGNYLINRALLLISRLNRNGNRCTIQWIKGQSGIVGLEVNEPIIQELVEEEDQELTTNKLIDLHREQHQEVKEVISSGEEEDENSLGSLPSDQIREICKMWETVQLFVAKHHPNKPAALRATDQFNDNAMSHFREILKKRQKQRHWTSSSIKLKEKNKNVIK